MTEFSPFSCPIFLGHPEASGCCFQSERLLYRREPNGVRAEPGKQKARSWRTKELARSSARENEWQKKGGLLSWEDRCGIGPRHVARKAEQKKSVASRSPQVPQWCSIRVAPATVSAGWLWEMRSAIVASVGDRNPMEVADDLGHHSLRLLSPYGGPLLIAPPTKPYQRVYADR